MLIWQCVNFTSMSLLFTGGLYLAASNLCTTIKDDHLVIKPKSMRMAKALSKLTKPALWIWAIGFVLQIYYQTHLLQALMK